MSPYNFPSFTTNENYGGFYDSPRISLQLVPRRIKNDQLESKKATLATSNSEYGGFLNIPRSTRWYVTKERPKAPDTNFVTGESIAPRSPYPRFYPRVEESPMEGGLRYNDRLIHLPDVDTVELHMKDKSRILLNVKEFYRRYLDN